MSQEDLEYIKRNIKSMLGESPDTRSEIDDLSLDDLEDLYRRFQEYEEPDEAKESQQEQQETPEAADTEEAQMATGEPAEPTQEQSASAPAQADPVTQYQQLLNQAHEMAQSWANQLGSDNVPFVEQSGGTLVYGVSNTLNPQFNRFSAIPIPKSLQGELDLSQNHPPGEVYRWALAEYKSIEEKAEEKYREFKEEDPMAEMNIRNDEISVLKEGEFPGTEKFKIPERIQSILEQG